MIDILQQTSYYVSQQQCWVDQIQTVHGSNLLYHCVKKPDPYD